MKEDVDSKDCGLTDAEHCNWQAWLDVYDLIMNLYESVNDINDFANKYSTDMMDDTGLAMVVDDVYVRFKPILTRLQKANKTIRAKYDIADRKKSTPSGRPNTSY